jgi:Phytanoyl-CoA dioxygenase (PhyH)
MNEIVAQFDGAGFAVSPDVLSEGRCVVLDAQIAALGVAGAGTRELLNLGWAQSLAGELRGHAALIPILEDARTAIQCTYFHKSPARNWLVSLHQDLSIPVQDRVPGSPCTAWSQKEGTWFCQPPVELLSQLVAIRVHLDDSTTENGPLRVVPGSHRLGRISSREATEHRRRLGEVRCTVSRRGTLAMRPLLLHASSKSSVDSPRRVLHFVFGPPKLPWGLRWRHAV